MKIVSINKIELESLSRLQKDLILLFGIILGFGFLSILESVYEVLVSGNQSSSTLFLVIIGSSVLLIVFSLFFSSLGNKFSGNPIPMLLCLTLSLAFAISFIFNIVSLLLPMIFEWYW